VAKQQVGAALLWMLSICSAAAQTPPPREIGWILRYDPPIIAPAVERDGRLVELTLGSRIHQQDTLKLSGDIRVSIGFVDGSERVFSGTGNWSMPTVKEASPIWQAMQSVLGLVERQGKIAATASTRSAQTCISVEPDDLRLPLFSKQQTLVAGVQNLHLAWLGGCPNYNVVLNRGGAVMISSDKVKSRSLTWRSIDLQPGDYTITLKDSRSKEAFGSFHVVTDAPAEHVYTARSETMAELVGAVELADRGPEWRAESVKRLERLAIARHPIALRLTNLWQVDEMAGSMTGAGE
jgi:hypothetical protein